jgi:hypothetical protein
MVKLNKKAQAQIMMTIIIALAFWMFGILFIGLIMPDVSISKSLTNLDCSNMSISDGNKLACLGVDSVVPAFIFALVVVGGGTVILKLIGN